MAALTSMLSLLFFGLISFRAGADLISIGGSHDGQPPSEVMNNLLFLLMLVILGLNVRSSITTQNQAKLWKQTPTIFIVMIILVVGIVTYFVLLNDPAEADHKTRIFCDFMYLFAGVVALLNVPKTLRSLRRSA